MGSDATRKRRGRRLRKGWACAAGACLALAVVAVCAFAWLSFRRSSGHPSTGAAGGGTAGGASSSSLLGSIVGALPLVGSALTNTPRIAALGLSLCPAGFAAGAPGCRVVDLELAHGIDDLRAAASSAFPCTAHLKDDLHGRCRLFDEDGLEVVGERELSRLRNGSALQVVKGDNHFFWPTVRLGHKWNPKHVTSPDPERPITMETISESPRVFLIDNFLGEAEIEYLVNHAKGRLERSHVGIGKETFHNQRTSKTAWDTNSKTSRTIQRRAYDLVRQPYARNTADAIQVIKYDRGQMYLLHTDYFKVGYDTLDSSKPDGTNRIVTIFMYLSDVEAGGATVFPHATTHAKVSDDRDVVAPPKDLLQAINVENKKMADCSLEKALKVHPKRGRAVLFYNQKPDGTLDIQAEHGGCPVAVGHKWAANVWIWNRARPRFGSGGKQLKVKNQKGGGFMSWFAGGKKNAAGHGSNKGHSANMKIEFSNERASPVEVFWQKPGGSGEMSFGRIGPNSRMPLNTFEGHTWVVRDPKTGNEIKSVKAKMGAGAAVSIT
jgi:prolyl 4-hydroxylase